MASVSFPTWLSVVSSSICARPDTERSALVTASLTPIFSVSNCSFSSGSALYPLQTSPGGHLSLAVQPDVSLGIPPLLASMPLWPLFFFLDMTKVSLCRICYST
jgi:hypothetical protein